MALRPWYRVVTPREDLREGKPLDASEFAVHLDQVRDGRAPAVYQEPEQFFQRTYLTKSLGDLASEVIRRLSGEKTETSAVFNMATQFGGGKTHALTLLYHLARNGSTADAWSGVAKLLDQAGMSTVPKADTAVFVGAEFDPVSGRGGDDGTPVRKTPWGEIAYQLGGAEALEVLAEHERRMVAPGGDVIRRFLPKDRPCLILMDELMNYVSRSRKLDMVSQLYSFLQNLSEEARGLGNMVLAVSIPASELEMSAEDHSDYDRLKKLLDRVGKAVIMSAETETAEIIRRRLFEWDDTAVTRDGRVLLPKDAVQTCNEYAAWLNEHRQQIPQWFPVDHAKDAFLATYPFHPMVLSVFERKWQELPRFQRTRGVLRLLALWVSRAYQDGFKGAHRDPLIGLGTAPLDDPIFRSALFEQLGEPRLEGAVTTDVCGKRDAHAVRLDNEAVDTLKKARLHRKTATAIFFESNGGQTRTEATLPEIRLAVAEPGLEIGNVETALESLAASSYYLTVERNRYRFSLTPNLNQLLADRRGNIQVPRIEERVGTEIEAVFSGGPGIERVFFPVKSSQILDRAVLTLVILAPEHSMQDQGSVTQLVDSMTREHGMSSRTFKSALVWCVSDSPSSLQEEARKLLAWEDIDDEKEELRLDDGQKRQVAENVKKARRDLKEAVWRTYKNVMLLGKDNSLRIVDLGLVHSSAANTMVNLILNRLRQDGDIEEGISPNFLIRNWPPAFIEWSTKAVRDAFFSSPQFPRVLTADAIKETIAKGVSSKLLAYVGKTAKGDYEPFIYERDLRADEVELSDDVFIITAQEAEKHKEPPKLTTVLVSPQQVRLEPGKRQTFIARGLDQHSREIPLDHVEWIGTGGTVGQNGVFLSGPDEGNFIVTATAGTTLGQATVTIGRGVLPTTPPPPPGAGARALSWSGEIPPQKWMNFYTKVLSRFATGKGIKLTLNVEIAPEGGIPTHRIEETKVALRELGLDDDVKAE